MAPFIVGTYYGKQQSRTSKEEMEREMSQLHEEILEMSKGGEIIIAMDANAKIGMLGEEISRNRKLLLNTLNETNLSVMNKSEKCKGKITRKNTKNDKEVSAIDLVVASSLAKD